MFKATNEFFVIADRLWNGSERVPDTSVAHELMKSSLDQIGLFTGDFFDPAFGDTRRLVKPKGLRAFKAMPGAVNSQWMMSMGFANTEGTEMAGVPSRHVEIDGGPGADRRRYFIPDMRSARECGFTPGDEWPILVTTREKPNETDVLRHWTNVLLRLLRDGAVRNSHVPISSGGYISIDAVTNVTKMPPWFIIRLVRNNAYGQFVLLSSCDADCMPGDDATVCRWEAVAATDQHTSIWLNCLWLDRLMLSVDDEAWNMLKHRGLVMHMTIQQVRLVLKYGHSVRGTDDLAQIYTAGTRTILIGAEEFMINKGSGKAFEVDLNVTMLMARGDDFRLYVARNGRLSCRGTVYLREVSAIRRFVPTNDAVGNPFGEPVEIYNFAIFSVPLQATMLSLGEAADNERVGETADYWSEQGVRAVEDGGWIGNYFICPLCDEKHRTNVRMCTSFLGATLGHELVENVTFEQYFHHQESRARYDGSARERSGSRSNKMGDARNDDVNDASSCAAAAVPSSPKRTMNRGERSASPEQHPPASGSAWSSQGPWNSDSRGYDRPMAASSEPYREDSIQDFFDARPMAPLQKRDDALRHHQARWREPGEQQYRMDSGQKGWNFYHMKQVSSAWVPRGTTHYSPDAELLYDEVQLRAMEEMKQRDRDSQSWAAAAKRQREFGTVRNWKAAQKERAQSWKPKQSAKSWQGRLPPGSEIPERPNVKCYFCFDFGHVGDECPRRTLRGDPSLRLVSLHMSDAPNQPMAPENWRPRSKSRSKSRARSGSRRPHRQHHRARGSSAHSSVRSDGGDTDVDV